LNLRHAMKKDQNNYKTGTRFIMVLVLWHYSIGPSLKVFCRVIVILGHRNLFSSQLHSKRLAKNPLFEVISLHGPSGPHQQPVIKGPLIESLARNITCLIPLLRSATSPFRLGIKCMWQCIIVCHQHLCHHY
jgi:hypothetical protein